MVTVSERTPTGYPHVVADERGQWWIDDTGVKLTTIVLDATGPDRLTPEQVQAERPTLTLAQIHAALTFYYDHRAAVDDAIDRGGRRYRRCGRRPRTRNFRPGCGRQKTPATPRAGHERRPLHG